MAEYYIIAAGGTGAMCARAFMYMAAAGCADAQATYHILLMDKDKESDAVTSCKNLLGEYRELQVQLNQKPDGKVTYTLPEIRLHQWNFTDEIIAEYQAQTGKSADTLDNLTLNKLLNPNEDPNVDLVLKTMYSADELDIDLGKGFYGHPNIGAPVFSYVRDRFLTPTHTELDGNGSFMGLLIQALQKGQAYVYLFGSLFGGTGATVIPSVVLALRSLNISGNNLGQTNLVLGGSVLMPYFRLPSIENDNVDILERIKPSDSKFAGQTRDALSYYHESGLLSKMMNLLLVGTTHLDVTSEIYARGGSQRQHFHGVLLVAATAANRFFAKELGNMAHGIVDGANVDTKGELLFWKFAPDDAQGKGIYETLTPSELGLTEEYKKLMAFLRFSVVVSTHMRGKFDQNPNQMKDTVEVQGTARQIKQPNGRPLDPKHITSEEYEAYYQVPVQKVCPVCQGFIRFMYDVALSGYDWSKYRVPTKHESEKRMLSGAPYYKYTMDDNSPIRDTAMGGFRDRWTDFANLTALKEIQDASHPTQVTSKFTLNSISSYEMLDRDLRQPYTEERFAHNIAQVYEEKTLRDLGLYSGFMHPLNRNCYFSEIYDQLYKNLGGELK